MRKIISIPIALLILLFCSNLYAQSVTFNVAGTNPRCESTWPNGATYSGTAVAPSGAYQIVDVKFQIQRFTGSSWSFWGPPFTVTPGFTTTSVNYSNATSGATALTLTPVNTIRMNAIIRYRTSPGGTIFTAIANSTSLAYNHFDAPVVDFTINGVTPPVSPIALNVYTCAGTVLLENMTNGIGTGVMWRLLEFQSTSGGNEGAPFDVNACGWKSGNAPATLDVLNTENIPAYAGCSIRPHVLTEGEYILVKLEVKNDCGTSSKSVLLRVYSQPSGATVNFFFRGSTQVDNKVAVGPNTVVTTGEQNPATGTVSNSDGVLSWGGTQASPTWVGASQTTLDCAGTNFYGGVVSWTVEIYYLNPTLGNFVLAGTYNEPNPMNTQISIQSVPMSVNGGSNTAGYFSANFNTSSTGVLNKTFKVKLIGNGICSQNPFKEGYFRIAPDETWWLVDGGGGNTGFNSDATVDAITIEDMKIAPNPSTGLITLAIESNENTEAILHILDMNAQMVALDVSRSLSLVKGYNSVTYDVSQLPSGTFVVEVITSGSTLTRRLVKL